MVISTLPMFSLRAGLRVLPLRMLAGRHSLRKDRYRGIPEAQRRESARAKVLETAGLSGPSQSWMYDLGLQRKTHGRWPGSEFLTVLACPGFSD